MTTLGVYKLEALGVLTGSLEFILCLSYYVFCLFFCLFNETIKLHAMNEDTFCDFFIGK